MIIGTFTEARRNGTAQATFQAATKLQISLLPLLI
jgi:hypothetical protein